MTAIRQQQKRPSSLPDWKAKKGDWRISHLPLWCSAFSRQIINTLFTHGHCQEWQHRGVFFGRSLGLGVVGRKGTEKNGAPAWSTETPDFVVFLNVLAPLDSDRIFSPKIALNG